MTTVAKGTVQGDTWTYDDEGTAAGQPVQVALHLEDRDAGLVKLQVGAAWPRQEVDANPGGDVHSGEIIEKRSGESRDRELGKKKKKKISILVLPPPHLQASCSLLLIPCSRHVLEEIPGDEAVEMECRAGAFRNACVRFG